MALHEIPHQRQADAQALADALGRFVDLDEEVPDLRELVPSDADAVVAHADHHVVELAFCGDLDAPLPFGVLGRVEDEVLEDLLQAHAVGDDPERLLRKLHDHLVPADLDLALAGLDRVANLVVDVERLAAQLDGPARDPRDIQQVLDQARHLRHLAVHRLEQRLRSLGLDFLGAQHVNRGAHGCQRVAQLVGEGRQEFVLALVGLLDLLVEHAVVERAGGAPDEAVSERQVGAREVALRRTQGEQQRAAGLAARHQRESVDLPRLRLVRGIAVGWRHREPVGHLGAPVGDRGLALALEHRVESRAVGTEICVPTRHVGIACRAHRAVVAHQDHGAEVGEERNHEAGGAFQDRVHVE